MVRPTNVVVKDPGAPPTISTVQRRHDRLRGTLYKEAGELFVENGGEDGGGFENTTVEAIAARADISTRTFFRHFESKADVIYLDLRRSMQEYFAALERRLSEHDPFSAAVLARIDQIEHFAQEPLNVARLLRALRSRNFVARRAAWYAELQEKLQQRLLEHAPTGRSARAQAALAAAMAVKVGEVGLLLWAASDGKGDPAASIAEAYKSCQQMFAGNRAVGQALIQERRVGPKSLAATRKNGE
jgi:AcrR family transcriptional regulator